MRGRKRKKEGREETGGGRGREKILPRHIVKCFYMLIDTRFHLQKNSFGMAAIEFFFPLPTSYFDYGPSTKKKKTFSMSPTYKSRRALYAYNFFVGHAVARRKLHQSCHRFSTNRNLNLKHKVFSGPLTVMAGEKLTRSHRLAAALVILITNFPN